VKRRRSRRWLWLPAAVALLLCWWFFGRTPHYRLIGTFVTNDELLIPAESGFLTRNSADSFVLRDWRDGHPRWSVTVRHPQLFGRMPRMSPGFGSAYSLSPDGHVFAAATVVNGMLHVDIWRDGIAAGRVAVPLEDSPPILSVKALNDGRVFCWRFAPIAIAVEGDRVIARGAFPSQAIMAPDGSALAAPTPTGFDYAAVRVADGAITLEHRYACRDPLGWFDSMDGFLLDSSMFVDGIVLANNGAVYGPTGQVRPADGKWRHLGMAPGGRYTLQFTDKEVRVFSPADGQAWAVTVPNENHGGDATTDGRHALAYLETRPPSWLKDSLRRYPAAERILGGISTDYLVLYRQPGRRAAVLRPRLRAWWPEVDIDNRWWFPSPDGRSVAMTASDSRSGRCFLLRY
jgi:hypothetical protein